jgi:quercetin dioxygenase-like cupin family protein
MEHPSVIRPADHAEWRPDKMGKSTLFESSRMLVGLNSFEPGQFHALHAHPGMDKLYQVIEGEGILLLDEGRELLMKTGDLVIAPEGVPHGIRNVSGSRLLVLLILAPAP